MLPPEEVSQRFAAKVAAHQAATACASATGWWVATTSWRGAGRAARATVCRLATAVATDRPDVGEVVLATATVLRGGDAVVAAVPLPVLSRLWPEMPLELGAVGYGVGGKISVQFSRRIWRDYGRNGHGAVRPVVGAPVGDHRRPVGRRRRAHRVCCRRTTAPRSCRCPRATDRIVAEIERIFPGATRPGGRASCTPTGRTTRTASARTLLRGRVSGAQHNRRCTRGTAGCGWPGSTPTTSPGSWRAPCAAVRRVAAAVMS